MLGVCSPIAAVAFQQERVGASSSATTTQAAPTESGTTLRDLTGSNLTSSPTSDPKSGTKLSIPGLGTVGVLPRMDFGLELLYGGNTPAQDTPEPEDESDDLRIRGSIKHRF